MIKEFTIKNLFETQDKYLIPIYQRNYAWQTSEIEQLLIDIDNMSDKDKNYYIGTLVVFEKKINGDIVYETIDGQQRLTTLSILLSVIKNYFDEKLNFKHLLKYESREISTNTLEAIYQNNIKNQENLNPNMENAYKIIKNYLQKLEETKRNEFIDYLLKKVIILRIEVPKDTDLNHYFEIMNNRGEQLEKHEIVKARMLSILKNDKDKQLFNTIWEASSNMSKYIQYGFTPKQRDKVFGDNWNDFICNDFENILQQLQLENNSNTQTKQDNKSLTIDEILNSKFEGNLANEENNKDIPDRFTSPINFSNFLLHVLKITKDSTISLDDKTLLSAFDKNKFDEQKVKKFAFDLLKLRFLFDNYIIKREYKEDKDGWSLQKAYKYTNNGNQIIQYKNTFENKNDDIIKILSMFHVSNPSQIYKYWLTGVLNYLNETDEINENDYLKFLEKLANKFLTQRYLAKEPLNFEDIIFKEKETFKLAWKKLDQGTAVEHFIFNYLDYLLWKENKKDFEYFHFSFSNSVEHFYPQHPIDGYQPLNKKYLDNFGNLCLISVTKNAKLNNHPPQSKLSYYPNNQYDSLKQHIMMKEMEKAKIWNEKTIKKHRRDMLKIFLNYIGIGTQNDPI